MFSTVSVIIIMIIIPCNYYQNKFIDTEVTVMAAKHLFSSLEPYKLTRVELTGNKLGHGSYASVMEVNYMGLKCAGKKIHEVLLEQGETNYIVHHFEEECRILSTMRHPSIVQFLGVYFNESERVPMLVIWNCCQIT